MAALEIGDPRREVVRVLGAPKKRVIGPTHTARRAVAVAEALGSRMRPIEVLVYQGLDVILSDGTVVGLLARQGYTGSTSSGLKLGMSVSEVQRTHGRLMFDAERHIWLLPGWPTLELEITRPARHTERARNIDRVAELYELTSETSIVATIAVQEATETD